jgi:hypothetical protein
MAIRMQATPLPQKLACLFLVCCLLFVQEHAAGYGDSISLQDQRMALPSSLEIHSPIPKLTVVADELLEQPCAALYAMVAAWLVL